MGAWRVVLLLCCFAGCYHHCSVVAQSSNGRSGSNWYVAPPGAPELGPCSLSELRQWIEAGYIDKETQVKWGANGFPQSAATALSSLGGGDRGGGGGGDDRGDSSYSGQRGSSNAAAAASSSASKLVSYNEGFVRGELFDDGFASEDEKDEDNHNNNASANRYGNKQRRAAYADDDDGDDSDDGGGGGRRGGDRGGGAGWRNALASRAARVQEVEGGRFSESVAAAKKGLKKAFGFGLGSSSSVSSPSRPPSRGVGNRDVWEQRRGSGGNGQPLGGGGGYGDGRYGIPSAPQRGYRDERGVETGRGVQDGNLPSSQPQHQYHREYHQQQQQQQQHQQQQQQPHHEQQWRAELPQGNQMPGEPPPPPPLPTPLEGTDITGSSSSGRATEPMVAGVPAGVQLPAGGQADVAVGSSWPPTKDLTDSSASTVSPPAAASRRTRDSSPLPPMFEGLDPEEVKAFYEAQDLPAGPGAGGGDGRTGRHKEGWRDRRERRRQENEGSARVTEEDYRYSGGGDEADRDGDGGGGGGVLGRRDIDVDIGGGGGGGGGGLLSSARGKKGLISVKSIGSQSGHTNIWGEEDENEGVVAGAKFLLWRTIACFFLPARIFATGSSNFRVLRKAVGVLPLLLWWVVSIIRGLTVVGIAVLGSRMMRLIIGQAMSSYADGMGGGGGGVDGVDGGGGVVGGLAGVVGTSFSIQRGMLGRIASNPISQLVFAIGMLMMTEALSTSFIRSWVRPMTHARSKGLNRQIMLVSMLFGAIGRHSTDKPSFMEFGDMCSAPGKYCSTAMELWTTIARLIAAAAATHLLWPVYGPAVVGGGALLVTCLEAISLALTTVKSSEDEEDVAGAIERLVLTAGGDEAGGGAALTSYTGFETAIRRLHWVMLAKHQTLLRDVKQLEHISPQGDAYYSTGGLAASLRGALWWCLFVTAATSALVVLLERLIVKGDLEPEKFLLGVALVWITHTSLLNCLGRLKTMRGLRPLARRMHAMALSEAADVIELEGGIGEGADLMDTVHHLSHWQELQGGVRQVSWEWGGWTSEGPSPAAGLVMDDVWLRYPGRGEQQYALKGVTFQAPAGSLVVVVGGEGCGKTSVVRAIMGFMNVCKGSVAFQGRDVKLWDSQTYRSLIAWIAQVSARFQLTVGENIGAGDESEFANRDMWARAASMAGCAEMIEKLPMGYDTMVEDAAIPTHKYVKTRGSRIVRTGLSEGEWQRIMISRTLMRADVCKALVMDEPFQYIDEGDALALLQGLKNQIHQMGQVGVLATRQMGLARLADLVVYMEEGQVVEVGTHALLLSHQGGQGLYAQAYRRHLAAQ